MDTRLWGGPLGILKQQYTTVHNNTPQSAQDGSSSSDEELDYHKLMERMTATAKPASKQHGASSSVRPATTSAIPDHPRNSSPLSVALNLSTQFSEAQDSPSVGTNSIKGSPGLVITPPRLHAAGYGDEVPSPSPVAWPSTQGRSFGRGDDDEDEGEYTTEGSWRSAPTPNTSGVHGLEIAPPPMTSFSNLSHPLSSPPASPQPSPSSHLSSPSAPVVRQLMTPPKEEELFTFSDAKQHCSPLHGNSLRAIKSVREEGDGEEDVTPFARDGWDAAIHQQQSLEQHPQGQHVQHDTTTEEQQVLSGRGIRAAGSVTRGGGSGVQWEDTQRKDPQRKHVAGGVGVHDQTRGKAAHHDANIDDLPSIPLIVAACGSALFLTCVACFIAALLPWDATTNNGPLVTPIKNYMKQAQVNILHGLDYGAAAIQQWQIQYAGLPVFNAREWVFGDMDTGLQHERLGHSILEKLNTHIQAVWTAPQQVIHTWYKRVAAPGPVISWRQTTAHTKQQHVEEKHQRRDDVPEIKQAQEAAQAQQWDQDLHSHLQRAGYLATRLIGWHPPTQRIHPPPPNPPQQPPSPVAPLAEPLDIIPEQAPVGYDWTWYSDQSQHSQAEEGVGELSAQAGAPEDTMAGAALQNAAPTTPTVGDTDPPAWSDSTWFETPPSPMISPPSPSPTLQARLAALPPPLKSLLRGTISGLRWVIAVCYWAALGALGGSITLAVVLTVLHVLPIQQGSLLRSLSEGSSGWLSATSGGGSSVLAAVPGAAREVSAVIARSFSTSLTTIQAAMPFTTHAPDFTWLRPNMVVPREAVARGAMLYRLLRNRLYMIPGVEHITAATQGRELGALLRQLTPTSPLFGFRVASEHAAGAEQHAPVHLPATTKSTRKRAPKQTPATPKTTTAVGGDEEQQGTTGRRGGRSATKGGVASAPRSSTRQRRTAAATSVVEETQRDSPALGTRSATRRGVRA